MTEAPKIDMASYETGHREGENSRTADVLLLFYDACTMDDLLAGFRALTGDPELEWPDGIGKDPAPAPPAQAGEQL